MKKLGECFAEFIGTFALVMVGIGAIHNSNGNVLMVALAHGFTIAVFATACMHISGGQFNPAVTIGLMIARKMTPLNSAIYIAAQLAGAFAAALVCLGLFDRDIVVAGTPQMAEGFGFVKGVVFEAFMTFFLMFVIFGTAVDKRGFQLGGLCIGLAVTLDILFGGPYTGAAMNPARVFGPALASGFWTAHASYWVGPILGAAAASVIYPMFYLREPETSA